MLAVGSAQFTLAIQYGWIALLPPVVWFLLRTGIVRTAATMIRVTAWDWLLSRKGVPLSARHKLLTDTAKRDLESS